MGGANCKHDNTAILAILWPLLEMAHAWPSFIRFIITQVSLHPCGGMSLFVLPVKHQPSSLQADPKQSSRITSHDTVKILCHLNDTRRCLPII